ncbi:MAG: hypothetical protein K2L74_06535 [Muribaculaceae bacterium]|nr:hypothetical protein [Muribaculaceae bacterium]
MKRMIIAAALAATIGATASTPDYELPLTADSFQGGWDSQYYEADHTIQFTKPYGGNGWFWYDGTDFSAYDQAVVEYSSRGPEVKLTVGYLGSESVSESRYMPQTYDQLVVDLDPSLSSKVQRIVIMGSEAGYVTIRRAYLRERPVVSATEPIVLFEGAQALDWWEHNVSIYPSAFAGVAAGDKITVDYTGSGSAGGGSADCIFKLDYRLFVNYEYDTRPLPGTTESPWFKEGGLHMEEYDGEEGSYTLTLTDADIEALTNPDIDCLFITGAHCIINRVTLLREVSAGLPVVSTDSASDAAPEYYDLSGRRVSRPAAGGVYIVRRGAGVSKELVR